MNNVTIKNKAENKVSIFYNTVGWTENNGITEDGKRWENFRKSAQEYVTKCRLKLMKYIPEHGENMLDMASGPIQYKEYLEYSKNFTKRYCVDLSKTALEVAEKKIGNHGIYIHGSFFDIPFEENYFDCSISLHTIYHMDKELQETAVRKLIKITKPKKPVIIIYSNPKTLISHFIFLFHLIKKVTNKLLRLSELKKVQNNESSLYFFCHENSWWYKFNDVADVKVLPWRSFTAHDEKYLFPDNKMGYIMFKILSFLENSFPNFFVKFFQYPMIILIKK